METMSRRPKRRGQNNCTISFGNICIAPLATAPRVEFSGATYGIYLPLPSYVVTLLYNSHLLLNISDNKNLNSTKAYGGCRVFDLDAAAAD